MARKRYPIHRITPTAYEVVSQLDADDRFQPRILDARLADEPAGMIVLSIRDRDDQQIAFMAEQWPSIRDAVDRLAAHVGHKSATPRA